MVLVQWLAEVRLLTADEWWDGPLSGLAEYDGREYWYAAVWNEAADDWSHPREFILHRISDEDLAREWLVHRDFEAHVSTIHCLHDSVGERLVRPADQHHIFYDRHPPERQPRFDDAPQVGRFLLNVSER